MTKPKDVKVGFRSDFADALQDQSKDLTRRWLEQLKERLWQIEPRRIFPTDALLNHIPQIIGRLAQFVEHRSSNVADSFVVEDLRRLAQLRRRQGYGLEEIQEEFKIFGEILFDVARDVAEAKKADPKEVISVIERLHGALRVLGDRTILSYSEAAMEERQMRSSALQEFGQVVSHEIRNRLNLAQLAVAGWETKPRATNSDQALGQALASSLQGLQHLAADVQTLALAQSSQESAWGRRRPLREVVEGLVTMARSYADKEGIELEIVGDLPAAPVDATRLELALINVLMNAIHYSSPDQESPRVEVRVERGDGDKGWNVMVIDNGIGVTPGSEERIFDFAARGSHHQIPGSGLGLAIARQAVEQLGGTITMKNRENQGSCFTILVPDPPNRLEDAENPENEEPEADPEDDQEPDSALADRAGQPETSGPPPASRTDAGGN